MNTLNERRRRLPDHVADAMTAILDHFWQEEARHYLACSQDEQDGHIFSEMLAVRRWLTGKSAGSNGRKRRTEQRE